MLNAEPVMNPMTAGIEINSKMNPKRNKPIPRAIPPQINDKNVAISGAAYLSPNLS